MSNATQLKRTALPVRAMTPGEEEDSYFRDAQPGTPTVSVESFERDRMCSKCGHWKSEHPWEHCTEPNWL